MTPNRIRRAASRLRPGQAGRGSAESGSLDRDSPDRVPVDRVAREVADRVGDADDLALRESIGLFLRRNARRETGAAVTLDESSDTLLTGGDLRVRTDASPVRGWSWDRYYLSVSALGVQLLVLGRLDGPMSLPVEAPAVLLATFVFLVAGFLCRRRLRRERSVA